jgi:hypothetical protein
MFKKGTFTIATHAGSHPIWGHVFIDRDLEEGVIQLQCGVLYPMREKQKKLTARGPHPGEPDCASLGGWTKDVPALWRAHQAHHDHRTIYVVARAAQLSLPCRAPLHLPHSNHTARPLFWIPPESALEQWEPESWKIHHGDKWVGILHAWEPLTYGPLEGVPEHPPDSVNGDRFALTYELWLAFSDYVAPPAAELHFSAVGVAHDSRVPAVSEILDGKVFERFPGAKCVIAACSYYKKPQHWPGDDTTAS